MARNIILCCRYDTNFDVGVVRFYNVYEAKKTFVWGSCFLEDGCSPLYAIFNVLMIYSLAFESPGMKKSILDLRNDNLKVKSFHEKTGAQFLRKDNLDTYYILRKNDYEKLKINYQKFIGEIKW